MKIRPEFTINYEEDDISIVRRCEDGTEEMVSPLSASAAMAWEGIERGMDRTALVDAVMTEFGVADRAQIEADLDALCAQLIALGYAEE